MQLAQARGTQALVSQVLLLSIQSKLMELLQLINQNTQVKQSVQRSTERATPNYIKPKTHQIHYQAMQTRSQQAESQHNSMPNLKSSRHQALYEKLKASQQVQKAVEEAKQKKKREEKRMQKENFAVQKQQLKNRCLNTSQLNFAGEFVESDEQVKTRLHSHLLTGRVQNKALQAFALEVSKRAKSDLKHSATMKEDFRVSHKIFKKAAKKATELLAILPRGILKRRLAELDLSNADTSLQRQIRALKRSERNQKRFTEDDLTHQQSTSPTVDSLLAFEESHSHYMQPVSQHPERDMENKIKVIEQPMQVASTPSKVARKPGSVKKSSLPSLDLATRSMNQSAVGKSDGRRLQFNDSVEVYFYPENKAQHEHHLRDNDDLDDDDEDFLVCEEPRLTEDDEDVQEMADPSFEELLFNYISHSLLPRITASQSSSEMAALGKRARRSRANSLNSPSVRSFASSDAEQGEEAGSDSDKSLSTNENSFPTTGLSSALNSAELGSPPSHQKTPTKRPKNRSYEVSKNEIHDMPGLATGSIALQSAQTMQAPQTASPNVHKHANKRSKLPAVAPEAEKASTPTKQSVRRCLFSEK